MATQILHLGGRPVDYRKPPKPTDMVRWSKKTTGGKTITASFRTIAHLDYLNTKALSKFHQEIQVIQSPYNKGVEQSVGTHDFDAVWDLWIPGVDPLVQQWFFRSNGFACWFRHPPLFGNHIHGFTLPPREGKDVSDDFKMAGFEVGKYVDGGWSVYGHLITSSQIADYYNHSFGLKGQHNSGADHSRFPKDIAATIFDLDKFVASHGGSQPVQPPAPPVKVLTKVHGADISHHNTGVDLRKAKAAGLGFLYHKATEGSTVKDDQYIHRRAIAHSVGLPFGAYHFARPDSARDAIVEARAFLAYAKPKPGDLIPVLDLEVSGKLSQAGLKAWAKAFSDEVKRETGVLPMIYSPWDLGLPNLRWVPRYNNSNTPPKIEWDIWQFSNGVFGSPNSFPGLGHVDLNTFHKGITLANIRIPAKEPHPTPPPVVTPPAPKAQRFDLMHISGQFSDTADQHAADALAVFTRASKRNVAWITGTEGGSGSNTWIPELRAQARAHGYRFFSHKSTDAWIAVRNDLVAGGWTTYVGPTIIPGKARDHTAKKVISVGFDTHEFGRINVIATHYLTKGRPSAKTAEYRQHLAENKALATAIGEYAVKVGGGTSLVFFGGDTNIVDRTDDVFFGQPLTTAWDELKKWENTGHGNIDVIASYDGDTRARAAYIRALDDSEWFLNTDHWAVEAGYDIAPLS